jgi:soluble lytic murein transglycosylase
MLASCTGPVPITATVTPTLLIQVGVTPSGTSLPIFTPSPTMTPEVRVETGEQALFNGNYDLALNEFQTAFETSIDPNVRSAALWGLGRDEYAVKNYGRALDILWQLISQYPASANTTRAYYLIGDIYMILQRYLESAQAYSIYLALRPGLIDAFVQEKRGNAYAAAGNIPEAVAAYEAALAAPHTEDDTGLMIKIGQAYVNLGDTTKALEIFDSIFTASSNDYIKAQMDLLSGQVYLSLGQTDQAYQRFLHAVDNYPMAYESYSALVSLVNAEFPVDEMNRGLVDFFAGQYGYALDAFTQVISSNPENDGTAHYYRAMTLNKMGNQQEAIDEYTFFIANFPANRYWNAAWDEKASLLSGPPLYEYEIASQTLLAFVQQAPTNSNAAFSLMQAARNQERAGNLEEASQTWDRVANEYPGSELVPQALFFAGITRFRLEKYEAALVTFQRESILSINLEDQTSSRYWIGKTQMALGDNTSAQNTWSQTAALDPTDYYSLRAQDMLFNRPAFTSSNSLNTAINLPAERIEAETWLRLTFNLPSDTDLNSTTSLLADPRFIRGTEFWTLGLDDQARLEFDSLGKAVDQNPADCFRLANYLLDLKLYYPAIVNIRQVLTLAGMETQSQTLAAPIYFSHIRYGLYFQDLILPIAQQAGFNPLFLFSVMRHESLFNKYANSTYAIGLMQLTPETGTFIVDNLGWPPNFTTDDLIRPIISIGLGTSYLQTQFSLFQDDFFSTLASYNAGPNATPIWRELSGSDSDLFLEVIRYKETQDYIRSIYEIFAVYRSLYTLAP